MEKKQKMKCSQLCNLLWDFENDLNRNRFKGRIKYILIHPNEFMSLANDKESLKFLEMSEYGVKFCGIPMVRTGEVEYVDFCV